MTKERKEQVQYLLAQYTEGLSTRREEALLFQILEEEKDNADWEPVIEEMMAAESGSETYNPEQWQPVVTSILNGDRSRNEAGGKIRKFGNAYRYAASVIVLLSLAVAGYIYYNQEGINGGGNTAAHTTGVDIAPGGNRAILTLADGSIIILDSAANGTVSQQGKTQIIKLDDGQLAYNAAAGTSEVLYNTISTPRGGQYQVVLPDGTKVWLNAASSLRFPTSFTGNERRVELTGEGYFEVAKNAGMPFRAKVDNATIEVLGTHFNVNAYHDEAIMKTTLLEGRVQVQTGTNQEPAILKPGQQARIQSDKLTVENNIDTREVMAWKDGFFEFENLELPAIMRQIERWYDVSVEYKKPVDKHFGGRISRNLSLLQVLRLLETGNTRFRLEANKIIVY